jgi:PAS domain S-box-containing protein
MVFRALFPVPFSRAMWKTPYVLALACSLIAALGGGYLLGHVEPDATATIAWLYLPPVLLVTIAWGLGPGIASAILADILILLLAVPPFGRFSGTDTMGYVRVGISEAGLVTAALFVFLLHRSRLAVEQISAAERARSAIVESSEDAIIGETLDGTITSWNAGAERLYGYTAGEVLGRQVAFLLPHERNQELAENLSRLRRGERIDPYQTVRLRKDGRPVDVSIAVSPIRDARGLFVGASAVARDISGQVRAQRALADSEAALRISRDQLGAIFQSVADGVMVQDADGGIRYANDAAARLCGYPTSDALLAAPLSEVIAKFVILDESGQPLPLEQLPAQRAFQGEPAPSAILRTRLLATGEEIWSAVQARPVLDEQRQVRFVVSAFQDITALKREGTRLRFLADASAMLANSLDYATILGRVPRLAVPEFADRCTVDLLGDDGRLHRIAGFEWDPQKNALLQTLLQHYPLDPEGPHPAAVAMRLGRAQFSVGVQDALLVAIAQDDQHLRLLRELVSHTYIAAPLLARDRALGAISFYRTVSKVAYGQDDVAFAEELARRAALAVDNARLYRDAQEALQARDEFLSSASHDLRTPLTVIRGQAQLLQRQVSRSDALKDPRLLTSLDEISRASQSMDSMIHDLLDLSRIEAGRPLQFNREETDLVALVRRAAEEQQRLGGLPITVEASSEPLLGCWDALRLERVFINLLSNAVKYSPEGGVINVALAEFEHAEDREPWAEVRVQDRGIGIPAGDLPRIFERFHRARNVSGVQGLGIGLAGAKQIVEQHGGTIRAESKEGHGSVFVVQLPCRAVPEKE